MPFEETTAIVTGGASGIDLAIVDAPGHRVGVWKSITGQVIGINGRRNT